MSLKLEDMTVEDVCDWFRGQQDIPDIIADTFREEYLDGIAIAIGLSTSPGPDWLKDVVSKVGLRLKVHSALRTLYNQSQLRSDSGSPGTCTETQSPNATPVGSISESVHSSGGGSSRVVTPVRFQKRTYEFCPDPFPIPKFRTTTEANFKSKLLTDSDRKYVVQTLSTMLMTHVSHPSLKCCGMVARSLIEKFTFLRDGEGDGEHSWKWFIYYRCQNVNRSSRGKSDNGDGPTRKKLKLNDWAVHSYPPVNADDDESYRRNLDILNTELSKSKPKSDILKTLMMRTCKNRFQELLNGDEPITVREHVTKYPLLKKPVYAALEFSSILISDNIRDIFEENFPMWARAIIHYSRETQTKSSAIQQECLTSSEEMDDEYCALVAIRCLCLLLVPMKVKKMGDCIPFIMKVVPHGTPTSEGPFPSNNQPHIVMFHSEEGSEQFSQYFISIEQQLMLETSTLISALFFCMAGHYIFNLSYHSKVKDFWSFLQEKTFELPTKDGKRKHSPSAMTHISGISRVFASLEKQSQDLTEMN